MPPGPFFSTVSSMKLRMKKIPRPLRLEDVLGRQRVGHFFRHEALALVFDANHESSWSRGTGLNSTITRFV